MLFRNVGNFNDFSIVLFSTDDAVD